MPIPQVTDRLKEAPAIVLRTVFAGIGQLLMAADKLRAQLEEQFAPPAPPSPPAGQGEAGSQQPEAADNVTLLSDRQGTAGQRPHTRPAGPAPAKAASSKPAATEPAATGATAAKPAPAKATTTKPAATKPAGAKPATARATPARATTPAGSKPATARATSAATTPAGSKPAAAKATATRPATAKPATTKPATAKPAAAKAATAKRAASTAPAPPIAGYDSLSVASLRARLRGLGPDGVRALLDYEQATARRDDVITMYERRLARLADETG
jgi:hypothetical protein